MLRSVLAVATGYLSFLILVSLLLLLLGIVFPAAVPRSGEVPSIGWAVFILAFGLVASAVGAAVTTAISRGSRLKHIHALALVVAFFGLVTLAVNIDKQPLWYLTAQIIVGVVGVYVGGHLANKKWPLAPAS